MATIQRGQPPARQTKVVHSHPSALKEGAQFTYAIPQVCAYDAASSKPASVGRDVADVSTHAINAHSRTDATATVDSCGGSENAVDGGTVGCTCKVKKCDSKRCMTCKHLVEGDCFISNTTNRRFRVLGSDTAMTWSTSNVVYLISCKRCGLQYVGETSQSLRCRFNNHRANLKRLGQQHIYRHFNSDGHSIDDLTIMPIEKIVDSDDDRLSLHAKRLSREEYWYRELCTIFPYGLNDNVKGVGSISRKIDSTVVWGLFNKHSRRNRKRGRKGNRKYRDKDKVKGDAETLLKGYKKPGFVRTLRGFVLGVAKNCLHELVQLAEVILRDKHLPQYLALIIKDIIRCRRGDLVIHNHNSIFQHNKPKSFIGVYFHNKGIEMINIAGILHSKVVRDTIPTFFSDKETPVVSYKYSKTIRSKLFNHKQTVNEIKFKSDKQNSHSKCDCEKSEYLYHPAGHVLTGDLGIIKDRVQYFENLSLKVHPLESKTILIGNLIMKYALSQ